MKNRNLAVTFLSFALTACGASDAIKATKGMPNKLDKMIEQVEATNATSAGILVGVDKTNESVDRQKLLVAIDGMTKPENTEYLAPPTGILPFAKTFAQYGSLADIFALCENFLTEVESVQTNGPSAVSTDISPEAKKLEHRKLSRLVAIELIAGLMPQSRIEELVKKQILEGGTNKRLARGLLMLRVNFLRDYVMERKLLTKPMDTPELLENAVQAAQGVDYIFRGLPQAEVAQIAFKTTGHIKTWDYKLSDDPIVSVAWWKRIQAELALVSQPKKDTSGTGHTPEQLKKLEQMRKASDEAMGYWQQQTQDSQKKS